ncbi:MAG: hypothetical protein SAK29_33145 [Scytonema sp. PMC 1069.18]|nr:hypothetical protein [Scytonema sp. PMC 1069.18]MEC4882847.1 hypothetical protein [Scytonema sp. PMC 1070.18]
MKTLVSHYQEIKDKLKSQLEDIEKTEEVVKIVQNEINKLGDFNGEYIKGLTPPQARLATVMLKALNQYTSILILVKLQSLDPNALDKSENSTAVSESITELTTNSLSSPFYKIFQVEKYLKALTSFDEYKQALLQQIQKNRNVISSLLTGGIVGTLAGGYSWGLIGAITGGLFGKGIQQMQLSESRAIASQPEPSKKEMKISIDIDKLLDHLYRAFQSIDLTVAAYGTQDEKVIKPRLENHLDLLEYLQDLMADALDEQTQLPIAVRRRIEQAATILNRYGIETRVYQSTEEQDLGIEAWSMFYFEPSLDPQITDYITIKHALVKENQVLLPGSVIEPVSSEIVNG